MAYLDEPRFDRDYSDLPDYDYLEPDDKFSDVDPNFDQYPDFELDAALDAELDFHFDYEDRSVDARTFGQSSRHHSTRHHRSNQRMLQDMAFLPRKDGRFSVPYFEF